MRAYPASLVFLLAALGPACDQPVTPPPDTDSETDVETDVETDDTDVFETGWDDSDTDTDTDETGDTEPDTGNALPDDTALCPFGERPDCDGTCYPLYFVGDGTCDDGSTFGSNFDCQRWSFDNGDCVDDSDTDVDTDLGGAPCNWLLRLNFPSWANENGWQVLDNTGRLLYSTPTGTYGANGRYEHVLALATGDYEFVLLDSLGDSWHGGSYTIIDPVTGQTIDTGTLGYGPTRAERPFSVQCDDTPPACGDLQLDISTQTFGAQIGWQVLNNQGATLITAAAGTYSNNQLYTRRATLGEGRYTFRMTDSFGDGWNASRFTLTDRFTGLTLATGSLPYGNQGDVPFFVDCSDTFNPTPDPAPALACNPMEMIVHTVRDGGDLSWELRNSTNALVARAAAGSYGNNGVYRVTLPMTGGLDTYTLRMFDRNNDGWEGGYVDIFDSATGYLVGSFGQDFLFGSTAEDSFTAECPEVEVPPVDTGTVCAPGTITDCNGICWPASYLNDGFCDDGSGYAPNFNCPNNLFDGGDCTPP